MDGDYERPIAAEEFPYVGKANSRAVGRSDANPPEPPKLDRTAVPEEMLGGAGARREFMSAENVTRDQLVRHYLHPNGHDIWNAQKVGQITASFQLNGQLDALHAVRDPNGQLQVFIDNGVLHVVDALKFEGSLRVDVWRLTDAQIADAIIRHEAQHLKLSAYERATVFKSFVLANGGVQRDCYAVLGFESESGLSRALAPVRLHPEILAVIPDKGQIAVGAAAKIDALSHDPQKRDQMLAWIGAHLDEARAMGAGKLLKALIERADPKPKAKLKKVGEESWVYCSTATDPPILARLHRADGVFQLTIGDVASFAAADWSRLRCAMAGLA